MPKFPETSCSQCGGSFGPGNHGFSHCSQHEYAAATTPALKTIRLRAIKLHEQIRDAERRASSASILTLSAFNAERSINKIDAELARRDEYLNAIGKAPSPHPLPQEK